MTEPVAAAPAAAKSTGGINVGKAWGIAILVIVLVMLNVVGELSGQLNGLLQVVKFNAGALLIIAAFVFFMKGKK